jgi:hypothetical protein
VCVCINARFQSVSGKKKRCLFGRRFITPAMR